MPSKKTALPAATTAQRTEPLKLGRQFRAMQVDGYDPAKHTVALKISSTQPVERWFGNEVLSHDPGAVRTQRMDAGMPLLFNHDADKHLGTTTGYRVNGDGIRTDNRFGDNPLAKEKEGDVKSGILKDVSLAYLVHKYQITQGDDGTPDEYKAIDWEPLENSLVTVPADITAGVGRSGGEDEIAVECVYVTRAAADGKKKKKKTKSVDGEDLTADCFIVVGDEQDPNTWHLPWKFKSEEQIKVHLRDALARFNQVEGLSEDEKNAAWNKLVRLCKRYGIEVSDDDRRSAFGQKSSASDDDGDDDEDDDDGDDPDDEDDNDTGSEPAPRSISTQGVRTMPIEVAQDNAVAEKQRITELRALRTQYPKHMTEDSLLDAIASGKRAGELKETIADKIIAESQRSNVRTIGDKVMLDMSEKERDRYSVVRVLRHAINQKAPGTFNDDADAGFEMEVSDSLRTMASRLGAKGFGTGIIMPTNMPFAIGGAQRAAQAYARYLPQAMQVRLQEAGGSTTGAAAVFTTTLTTAIELLRNRARVGALGAQMLGGLDGIVRMPRQTAASSSTWLAENSPSTDSGIQFDDVVLSPNRLGITGSYTIELLAQSSLNIEDMLRMDQAVVQALSVDYAWINGSGTPPVPQGLLGMTGLASVLTGSTRAANGTFTAGLGGVSNSYVDIVSFETAIAKANADAATMGWMFTPEVRGALKTTPKFPSGIENPIWKDSVSRDPNGLEEGPLGYKAGVTNQLPKNLTFTPAGGSLISNLHAEIFGDFSSAIIADWGVKEVVVDNITQAKSGVYIITENALYDTAVRHLEKFCASQCVLGS